MAHTYARIRAGTNGALATRDWLDSAPRFSNDVVETLSECRRDEIYRRRYHPSFCFVFFTTSLVSIKYYHFLILLSEIAFFCFVILYSLMYVIEWALENCRLFRTDEFKSTNKSRFTFNCEINAVHLRIGTWEIWRRGNLVSRDATFIVAPNLQETNSRSCSRARFRTVSTTPLAPLKRFGSFGKVLLCVT